MSIKIASFATSSYYFNFHGRDLHNLDLPRSHTTIKRLNIDQISPSHILLKFTPKYGTSRLKYRDISVSCNIQQNASSASNSSSSPWKKWLLGILFTIILPAAGHKGGFLLGLKVKIDNAIETVEHVTEVVEEIASEADKMIDEVEEKLPGDSKLREALESIEDLAEKAVKEAKKAEDLIHKVKEVEEEIEEAMIKASNDQAKK